MASDLDPRAVATGALLERLNSLVADDQDGMYTAEGLELLSILWMKVAAERKLMYEANWLGRQIIQLPNDLLVTQEIIWRTKPDVIVEAGIAHGGSLIFSASVLELMGHGKVIGVDVEIRPHNRSAIEAHPLFHRIDLVEGDSIAESTLDRIRQLIPEGSRVMVALDSNHTHNHVAAELAAYHHMVTPGCYLIAEDGSQFWVWDIPRGRPEWAHDHPLSAIEEFVATHPQFVVDEDCTRFGVTSSPRGYLLHKEAE